MSARGSGARQSLWRTGALKQARELKTDLGYIVSRLVALGHKTVMLEWTADRKPGVDPYERTREWGEYIENMPSLLTATADELRQISRQALLLAKSFEQQAALAGDQRLARAKLNAEAAGKLTAERMRAGQ